MVQGPKGSKRRKIRPRSGRSMARKRVEAAIDHYNGRVEYRASCTGGVRAVTTRDRTGDRGETHASREREREKKREREREKEGESEGERERDGERTRLFSVISGRAG